MDTATAYDRALAYAAERGRQDGTNAAEWYLQDTIGGRSSGDPTPAARRILQGLEDGDPAILDGMPSADLSGQWADSLTGPQLVEDAIVNADDWTMSRADWVAYWAERDAFTPICDAYDDAFSTAVEDEIARAARLVLRLEHAHDGGTIHNHEHYAVTEMSSPGAEHEHEYRADWNGAR